MLDNQYAILFIRGERPVMDFKYDILKHPNVALTADGKASAVSDTAKLPFEARRQFRCSWLLTRKRYPEDSDYGETNLRASVR